MSGFARRFANAVEVQAAVDASQGAQEVKFADAGNAANGAALVGAGLATAYAAKTVGAAVRAALAAPAEVSPAQLGDWLAGVASTADRIWLYAGRLWTGFAGALPAAPNFTDGYLYRKASDGWTPEQFGATGLGTAAPDTVAFATMLAKVPAGAVIWLRSGAWYHNALPAGVASNWIVTKQLSILGYGAKLSRRASVPGDPDQLAVLDIRASGVTVAGDIDIDGREPEAIPVNSVGAAQSAYAFARCGSSSHGVVVQNNAQGVRIDVTRIHHNSFNVLVWGGAGDFTIRGRLDYSGQVYPVTGADLQLGAGIKLSGVDVFDIDVRGLRNTNACVEIEPSCSNGKVRMHSDTCLSGGLTITSSHNIRLLSVFSRNAAYGAQISQGCYAIRGAIEATGNVIAGLWYVSFGGNAADSYDVKLDVLAYGNTGTGMSMRVELDGSTGKIRDFDIHVTAHDNASGNGVYLLGVGKGVLRGQVKSPNVGVAMDFVNGPRLVGMDLMESPAPYYAGAGCQFDIEQVMTPQGRLTAYSGSSVQFAKNLQTVGVYQFGAMTDFIVNAGNFYTPTMPASAAATFSGAFWTNAGVINRKP
ncbi:MAG TPA: hypothetical protein VNU71_14615 [Burkholderiaceae bacterium]|nr:hypothetical protein [Burkholderiaceae bacterium]